MHSEMSPVRQKPNSRIPTEDIQRKKYGWQVSSTAGGDSSIKQLDELKSSVAYMYTLLNVKSEMINVFLYLSCLHVNFVRSRQ